MRGVAQTLLLAFKRFYTLPTNTFEVPYCFLNGPLATEKITAVQTSLVAAMHCLFIEDWQMITGAHANIFRCDEGRMHMYVCK